MTVGFLDLTSTLVVPDRNIKKNIKPLYSLVSYGEGYESRVSLGTNSFKETYQLTFTNRSINEIERISGFINEREKYKNFVFTVPDSNEISGEKDLTVYCEGYSRTYITDTIGSLSCTFIRVFEDDSALSSATILNSSIILDEGVSEVINVSTSQRGAETLYWTLDEATTADFTAISGSFLTGGSISTASGSFSIETLDDTTTEGGEVYTLSIRAGSISGVVIANKEIQVIDTSRTPPVFTWANSVGTPITEIGTLKATPVTIQATTTNFDNTELLYWNFDTSSGIYSPTFGSVKLTGSFANSAGDITLTSSVVSESKTDVVTLRRASITGPILDTVTIITFPFIGRAFVDSEEVEQDYYVSSSITSPEYLTTVFCKGIGVEIETLYWTIEGATLAVDYDFISGTFTPIGTVVSSIGSFNLSAVPTATAKGFTLNIRTGSVSGPIVLSTNVFITDDPIVTNTSQLSQSSITTIDQSNIDRLFRGETILGSNEESALISSSITSLSTSVTSTSKAISYLPIVIGNKQSEITASSITDLTITRAEAPFRYVSIIGGDEESNITASSISLTTATYTVINRI